MFYRYEVRLSDNEEWRGICTYLNPSERRKVNAFMKSPKWYDTHPDVNTEAWFTEFGYNKHRDKMEKIISNFCWEHPCDNVQVHVRTAETLENIAICGKVQCIRLFDGKVA